MLNHNSSANHLKSHFKIICYHFTRNQFLPSIIRKKMISEWFEYKCFLVIRNCYTELFFVNSLTTTILCTDKQNLDVNKKNVHLFVYCLMISPRQKTAFVESFAKTVGSTNFDFAKKIDFLIIICSC